MEGRPRPPNKSCSRPQKLEGKQVSASFVFVQPEHPRSRPAQCAGAQTPLSAISRILRDLPDPRPTMHVTLPVRYQHAIPSLGEDVQVPRNAVTKEYRKTGTLRAGLAHVCGASTTTTSQSNAHVWPTAARKPHHPSDDSKLAREAS